MSSDLTFITNEEGQSLAKRFSDLIKDTCFLIVWLGMSIRVVFILSKIH